MTKVLAFFDTRALELTSRMEVVEMAAGFLRAFFEDENSESYLDLLDTDIFQASVEENVLEIRLETLTKTLEVLRWHTFLPMNL